MCWCVGVLVCWSIGRPTATTMVLRAAIGPHVANFTCMPYGLLRFGDTMIVILLLQFQVVILGRLEGQALAIDQEPHSSPRASVPGHPLTADMHMVCVFVCMCNYVCVYVCVTCVCESV